LTLVIGNVSLVDAVTLGGGADPGNIDAQTGQTLETLTQKATKIANYALGIIGLIAVFIILYSGFLFMTSGGEEEGTDKAKNYLKYGIIGLIVAALAFSVVGFVDNLFTSTG
jgi:Na+-driven multidrug efflux pump